MSNGLKIGQRVKQSWSIHEGTVISFHRDGHAILDNGCGGLYPWPADNPWAPRVCGVGYTHQIRPSK